MEDAQPLRVVKEAVGVGGSRPITHSGRSGVFNGLKMACIESWQTPNLMSLGRVLQANEEGLPGVAIFSHQGAVRFRADARVQQKITKLVDELYNTPHWEL